MLHANRHASNKIHYILVVEYQRIPLKITFIITTIIRYKTMDGENFGEFGELQDIQQNVLVQNFLI